MGSLVGATARRDPGESSPPGLQDVRRYSLLASLQDVRRYPLLASLQDVRRYPSLASQGQNLALTVLICAIFARQRLWDTKALHLMIGVAGDGNYDFCESLRFRVWGLRLRVESLSFRV